MRLPGVAISSLTAVCLVLFALAAKAEEKSLRALIPWEGEGTVFRIGPSTLLFLGDYEGIMYVETAEGEVDEAFVRCPASQKLNLETDDIAGSGYCMIIPSEGDTVYAEWSCAGGLRSCAGTFTVTGGTGQFEGIEGSSRLVVRSPLRALAADMASGSVVHVASGIAILPELRYRIPATE